MISRMEKRLADWTHLDVSHQEDTQILRCTGPLSLHVQQSVPSALAPSAACILCASEHISNSAAATFHSFAPTFSLPVELQVQ